jgi:tellurium resistance protein TerZ
MSSNINDPKSGVGGITITIQIIAGKNLVAKDRSLFGRKKTTSDPYVIIRTQQKMYGRTRTIQKNCLNPTWNETIKIELNSDDAQLLIQQYKQSSLNKPMIDCCIMDEDLLSDPDPMGVVQIPIPLGTNNAEQPPQWYPVTAGTGAYYCSNATGELQISVTTEIRKIYNMQRGCVLNSNLLPNQQRRFTIGLSWDIEQGKAVDLDSCCVAIDRTGNVLMKETVYYGNLSNSNHSIKHSGDELTGAKIGDDECINLDLNRLSNNVLALYVLLFVASPPEQTFNGIKSAQVRILATDTNQVLCRFVPSDFGTDSTALVLVRIARCNINDWTFTPIADSDPHARDFGSLIPEIKGYTRDLIPSIVIDPRERIAVMRKGGTIRVTDYVKDHHIPEWLTFGLAWDVTNGVNIDLDASAILLDKNLSLVDAVWFRQLTSRDGSIKHSGDEREGDAVGDDEKINFSLSNVPSNVTYIGLIINSFSGQELDDIAKASCHLFDPKTNVDVATYTLTNCAALNHHTALVMGCLYRSSVDDGGKNSTDNSWCLRIIAEPADGRTVHDNVDELQRYLQTHPPQPPSIPPEPEIVLNAMPDPIVVEEEDIVIPMQEEEINLLLK